MPEIHKVTPGETAIAFVLECDLDPEFDFTLSGEKNWAKVAGWRGLVDGIPCLLDSASEIEGFKATWFLRSDWMMYKIYGEWAYPCTHYETMWKKLASMGHEIGWHPHLARLDKKTGVWRQETKDEEWIGKCLRQGHEAISKWMPGIRSAKMGWDFHSNSTMGILDSLGIKVDCSANPGMAARGTAAGNSAVNIYDWSSTGQEPYHPSRNDYMVPPKNGETPLEILELPMTVHRESRSLRMPSLIAKRVLGRVTGSQMDERSALTLNSNPEVFKKAVKAAARAAAGRSMIIIPVDFHPYDLLGAGLKAAEANLGQIGKMIDSNDNPARFATAFEAAGMYCEYAGKPELKGGEGADAQ